jgi:3-deoxy-D-manno-octulosonic-acid transferase
MWRFLYNSVFLLATPVIVAVMMAKPRCRRGFLQRMGWQAHPSDKAGSSTPLIWIHAVSLGEVTAIAPLVKALHGRRPEYRYIVSTVTETGREAVEQRLAGIAEHRYAPLDFSWAVSGMIDRLRPVLYLFVETELWPNLLWTLRARQVPAVLVNGRLSSRSFSRQDVSGIRSFYRSVLRCVSLCLMQSDRDRQRIVALGAEPDRVHVTGNIKFDQPAPVMQEQGSLRRSLGLDDHERLLLAGSTHEGEEELLVAAYQQVVKIHPSTVLMMAPRHIERVDRVEAMIRAAGLTVQRKSRISQVGTGPRVIILDTRGELARAYGDAVVAFVGGTLVPVGGHNLLEPAVLGKPVLFGPYTDHCAEVAALLHEAGGGRRVMGLEDLVLSLNGWLADREACEGVGQVARRVVLDNQGALARSLELIESCLVSASSQSNRVAEALPGPLMARS